MVYAVVCESDIAGQSYGLAERLLREGNQMHAAVSAFIVSAVVEVYINPFSPGFLQPKSARRY